jgi:hypothetical protein
LAAFAGSKDICCNQTPLSIRGIGDSDTESAQRGVNRDIIVRVDAALCALPARQSHKTTNGREICLRSSLAASNCAMSKARRARDLCCPVAQSADQSGY